MASVATSVSLEHLAEAAAALSKLGSVDCNSRQEHVRAQDDEAGHFAASLVSDDDDLQQGPNDANNKNDNSNNNTSDISTAQSKEIFPQRLLAILSDPSLVEIISWLPNGRSFVILRPDVLAEEILPKYLPPAEHGRGGTVKYPSFTRKLNRWGFRQITRGPSTGAFHHPLFCRDQPELCVDMVCQKSRKRKSMDSDTAATEVSPNPPSATTRTTEEPRVGRNSSSSSLSSGTLPPKKRRLCVMDELDISIANSVPRSVSKKLQKNETVETNPSTPTLESQATLLQKQRVGDDDTAPTLSSPSANTIVQNDNTVVHTILRNNADFVASVLKERDEKERMKVAQSMLLKAFLEASAAAPL